MTAERRQTNKVHTRVYTSGILSQQVVKHGSPSLIAHPIGDGSGGAVAATSAARAGQDPLPGAVTGHQGESLPPSPPQKRAQRAGGKRVGQPRRPMQTLCDEHRAPACKSCKGHRGVRHCCSRHHEGHPRVLGGGQRCLPVQRGGLQQQAGVLPSGGSALVPAPVTRGGGGGGGWGASRAGDGGAAPGRHTGPRSGPREGLRGGHIATGRRPSAAPRHTGGAGGGIGQA